MTLNVECASAACNGEGKLNSQFETLLVWDNSDESTSIIFWESFVRRGTFGNKEIHIYINITADILIICLYLRNFIIYFWNNSCN